MTQEKRRFFLSILFTAGAASLRFFHLEEQSLWNDEMFTFDVANTPLFAIQSKLIAYYHHPPLFFYLAHFIVQLFGQHAWALRLVSAIAGSLTVGVVYAVTSKLFDERSAVIAGLLILVAPFHLAYSQEGRPYALAGLLTVLSFYFLIAITEKQSLRLKFFYVFSLTALLYTHHWGVFVAASHVVWIFISGKDFLQKKMFVQLWLIAGLLYIPEAFALLVQTTTHDRSGWFWTEYPNVTELLNLCLAYSGSYFNMASSVFDSPLIMKIIGGVAVCLTGIGAIILIAKSQGPRASKGAVVCFMVTLLIPFIISFVRPEIFLWYRYTVVTFPLFCIFAGVIASQNNLLYRIAVSCIVLVSLSGTMKYYSWQKSKMKDVAQYVESVAKDDVRFIIRPTYVAPLFNYYYKGSMTSVDEAYLDTPLGGLVDTAKSFVYVSLDVPNEIRSYFDIHFVKKAERGFSGEAHMGIVVGVYRQKDEYNEQ